MDWYVPNDSMAASELRDQFTGYLRRHASDDSDFGAAELIFAELVNNAMENSQNPIWVSVSWGTPQPVLSVHDLGSGFDLPQIGDEMPGLDEHTGRGLLIVTHLTDHLEVATKAAGGTRVRATLPVQRPPVSTVEPDPMPAKAHLPMPDEMNEHGQFGREAFLRALVVQLAQVVERDVGPVSAERAISSVGSGVGVRMEDAYRQVRQVGADPLETDVLGDVLVHLKAGIDGDFFVIDADDDRIVLGNRRCPFGDAVKQAPALCQMTSSVFGGIAARNRGGAAVHLEERIAVGDPQCKVTVWLTPPPAEIETEVHFYGDMAATDG